MDAVCRICMSRHGRKAFDAKGRTYYRCPECGTLFIDPVPSREELQAFYNSRYRVDPGPAPRAAAAKWARECRRLSRHAKPPGRLLEVGSSWGGFLLAARKEGWDAHGVDISRKAVQHARDELGLKVAVGTLQETPCAGEPFDLVVFWHVIEHDRDPRSFMHMVADRTRPGGVVAFTTPNAASLIARLAGPGWEWASPPEHLLLLPPRAVRVLLREGGLEPISIRTRRGDARPFLADLVVALIKRLGLGRVVRSVLGLTKGPAQGQPRRLAREPRRWQVRAFARLVGHLTFPFWPIGWVLYRLLDFGPELVVTARRPT